MSRALKAQYGFSAQAVAFFNLFANLPRPDDNAFATMQDGLDHGVAPTLIHGAARLLQGYELMFWDGMAEAAVV
jgi:hypothetical protein